MKSLTFAAIQRYSVFSPNHVGNDSAIFTEVANYLHERGHKVNYYTEHVFLTNPSIETNVFTMMRSKAAIKKLQRLEKEEGVKSYNSAFGIENCTREQMTQAFIDAGIPHPDSIILDTYKCEDFSHLPRIYEPCWVKRADFHAIHKEDVTYVRNNDELRSVMAEYALRGIDRVVINQHLVGDLIKFYGVQGSDFFHWFYPQLGVHSKFGLEAINGEPRGINFSVDKLRALCADAANLLNVKIYGGDCIVSPDGEIRIIDFNDWPSFAPCRMEAAKAIGQSILDDSIND